MLPLEEAYDAVFAGGVWLRYPSALRLIRLTGPQRVWFLQNTVTADIEAVEPGHWVESCLLDEKGRIFAHFRVAVGDEEILIADDPAYGPRLADWFISRRFRTKVEIEATPTGLVGVIGTSLVPDGEMRRNGSIEFGRMLGDVPATDSYGTTFTSDLSQAPFELHDVLRIEAGEGRFGVDFDERTLPQEAGLSRTLSVEKGCYVGQETVARIHFRGHINKVIRPLTFQGIEAADLTGSDLTYEGTPVGRVTSAVRSPRKGVVGLGMVRVELPEGARLSIGTGEAILGPLPEGTKVKTG